MSQTNDPYIDLDTGILRNLPGYTDAESLRQFEYKETAIKTDLFLSGRVHIPFTGDAEYIKALHKHLFENIYDWAGQYRTINLFKGTPGGFADCHTGMIQRYLTDMADIVRSTDWNTLRSEQFCVAMAEVFAYLNQAHPFREGNGRTSKLFLSVVASQAGRTLDYKRVSPKQWNMASMLSGPDLGTYEPMPDPLVRIFEQITTHPTVLAREIITSRLHNKLASTIQLTHTDPQPTRPPEGRTQTPKLK